MRRSIAPGDNRGLLRKRSIFSRRVSTRGLASADYYGYAPLALRDLFCLFMHPANPAHPFLTNRRVVFFLALLCCVLWGSSYPAIKGGYALFGIAPADVPSKLVFAGWRFLVAGLLLLVYAVASGQAVRGFTRREWTQISLLGLTQTTLQYVFFYVGLAYTSGVKSSIMNATGTFFSVLLAHFIFHNDRLSFNKVVGCIAGFAGVMVVNLGSGLGGIPSFEFTLLGEGFVVIAALVLAAASIYGKRISQGIDPIVMTGLQLSIGGAALLVGGYASGGHLSGFTPASTALLVYIGCTVLTGDLHLEPAAQIQPREHDYGLQLYGAGLRCGLVEPLPA